METKMIPQNIEAEQNVLCAMLIDKKAANLVAAKLKPEDFYRISHQLIYRAMLNLLAKNKPVDLVTVPEELSNMGSLDDVGGVSYITLLAALIPTAANVRYHAEIVERKAILRQLVESGTAIAAMGYEGGEEEINGLLDQAEKKLLRLSYRNSATDFVPVSDIMPTAIDRIGNMVENDETVTGLSTGFTDLDELIAGLQPSDFIILAARPSMGKTALALNIAQNVALRGAKDGEQHKRVAFFSLEMSRDQLVQRIICSEADIDKQDLGRRNKSETTQDEKLQLLNRVWSVSDKIAASAMYIDDTPFLSMQEMRSKARRLKAEGGLSLIVIDYLQLMNGATAGGFTENRQHQVSEISRGLKALARELNVPVLALSQLSRNVESRQVKRPMLSDLRESGSLEQDADIVMFLYREDYYKSAAEAPDHLTELIVAKHRNGPVGKINLFFKDDCTKFISMNEKDAC